MFVLAFDTSTPAVTVALGEIEEWTAPEGDWLRAGGDGVTIRAERTVVAANRHGEHLAPLITEVLDDGGVTPAELSAIAVGIGPGPFTGLRVGIVTAKAMADALGVPVYAEMSLGLITKGSVGVATNARRKQVYWAIRKGGRWIAGPDLSSPEDAARQFAEAGVSRVAGEGILLYPDAFAGFETVEGDVYPRADDLVARVAPKVMFSKPGDDLAPLYLRRPDAQPPGPPKQVTPA